jgi:glyoxylase-like metal-dependent hydrolase (beta-lactamase superfamily II)
MLEIITIRVTPFEQNARIVADTDAAECVLIDPGGEASRILGEVARRAWELKAIWLTHSHIDHCGGVKDVLAAQKVPLYAHPAERVFRERVDEAAARFGIPPGYFSKCPEPDVELAGGQTLTVGRYSAKMLFTPGHSPGHIAMYFESERALLSGDALFRESIGRTDLPGGDMRMLLESIRRELLTLPEEVRVFSGHGPETTIGHEKRNNPFLQLNGGSHE